jgi:hypothetical protein
MSMLRVIYKAISGLVFLLTGIYVGYLYLNSLQENGDLGNLLLLGLSFFLVGIAIVSFIKVSKSDDMMVVKAKEENFTSGKPKPESLMKKNNDIVKEWNKTVTTRDRLKMLEISAAANDE